MERFGDVASRLSSAAALFLGWRPHEFWGATPAELALALGPQEIADVPDRARIAALRQRFPDTSDR